MRPILARVGRPLGVPDFVGVAFGCLLLALAIFSVRYIPTHDGPNHLAGCVLRERLSDPTSFLHAYLQVGSPLSSAGFSIVCGPLVSAFGWQSGFSLTLYLLSLSFALGYMYLSSGVAARSPSGFLGFAFALPWAFYMGFFEFFMASAMSLAILGALVRKPRLSLWTSSLFGAAFLLASYVHLFAGAYAVTMAALLVLLRSWSSERLRGLGWIAIMGLPTAILGLVFVWSFDRFAGVGADLQGKVEWHSVTQRLIDLSETFLGGDPVRAMIATVLCVACALTGLVYVLVGRRCRFPPLRVEQTWVVLLSGGALLLFLLSPFDLPKWSYFSPRLLLVPLGLAPVAFPDALLDRGVVKKLVKGLVMTFAGYSLTWSYAYHRALSPTVAEVLSGLEADIRRDGPRLPLIYEDVDDSRIAHAEPLVMMGHLYLFDQGGVDPYLWADEPKVDPILFKSPSAQMFPPFPPRFARSTLGCPPPCPPRHVQYELLAYSGRNYQDVILFTGDPELRDVFRRRGYEPVFEHGRLSILEPRLCRIGVRLIHSAPSALGLAPLLIELGRVGVPTPSLQHETPPHLEIPAGGLTLWLAAPDCGSLRLSVTSKDTSDSMCREALSGEIRLEARPSLPSVAACTLQVTGGRPEE
ncbi:MAG: hypothetical protein IPK13_23655 [Deltaproteobacteria bacterium]|nr:hypothetical protein [Deltaproteobacteria bacterium]